MSEIALSNPSDFHIHLRQGTLCDLVTKHLAESGISTALVMPNLLPPLLTPSLSTDYITSLRKKAPDVRFLPTVYLSPTLSFTSLDGNDNIVAAKWYPPHTTTNSAGGEDMPLSLLDERYRNILGELEKRRIILCIHGETPALPVLDAEGHWMTTVLHALVKKYPNLRIVIEHLTTKEGVDALLSLPDSAKVAATITPHHLVLTTSDWAGQSLHFCKPVAKTIRDRTALREAVASGNPRFFLGTDSAPHPSSAKLPSFSNLSETSVAAAAAGIYLYPHALPVLATIFEAKEEDGLGEVVPKIPVERMEEFCCKFGRQFYGLPDGDGKGVRLVREKTNIPLSFHYDDLYVIPFWAGKEIGWRLRI
ncbi:Metallo-dependent hydrolase [Atractiella rhizophila]|nr:Metallo-dependent hydrolase [Atractiella rhizophila]